MHTVCEEWNECIHHTKGSPDRQTSRFTLDGGELRVPQICLYPRCIRFGERHLKPSHCSLNPSRYSSGFRIHFDNRHERVPFLRLTVTRPSPTELRDELATRELSDKGGRKRGYEGNELAHNRYILRIDLRESPSAFEFPAHGKKIKSGACEPLFEAEKAKKAQRTHQPRHWFGS